MIDFRPYYYDPDERRIFVHDGGIRPCIEDELKYIAQSKQHDDAPPWEKSFVFSSDGLAQLEMQHTVKRGIDG
jgi:hypothetical protein